MQLSSILHNASGYGDDDHRHRHAGRRQTAGENRFQFHISKALPTLKLACVCLWRARDSKRHILPLHFSTCFFLEVVSAEIQESKKMTVIEDEKSTKKRSLIVDTEDEDEIVTIKEEDPISQSEEEKKDDQPEKKDKDPNSGIMFYLMSHHLWIFAIWLVPISIVYDVIWWIRARWTYWICRSNANLRHDEKVFMKKKRCWLKLNGGLVNTQLPKLY